MQEELTYHQSLGLMCQIANKIAQFNQYKNWSDDFCRKEANSLFERQSKKYKIDPTKFRASQLNKLGSAKWSDDSSLMLLPLWMVSFLPKGLEVECIDGDKKIVGVDKLDNDIRFGCVSYGVYPKQENSNE